MSATRSNDLHHHSSDEEREIREAALDETIAGTFPASDPPSTLPNPHDHGAIGRQRPAEFVRERSDPSKVAESLDDVA